MNCPVCREPMIVLEHDQVEIDHCVSCKGIWLDRGELELLTGNVNTGSAEAVILSDPKGLLRGAKNLTGSAKHLADPSATPQDDISIKKSSRTCPICSKQMEVVLCEDVQMDRCQAGDGLWFDLGELECILRLSGLGGNAKVLEWLRTIFVKAV